MYFLECADSEAGRLSKPTILLADDHPGFPNMVERLLMPKFEVVGNRHGHFFAGSRWHSNCRSIEGIRLRFADRFFDRSYRSRFRSRLPGHGRLWVCGEVTH